MKFAIDICPICKTKLSVSGDTIVGDHVPMRNGKIFYFCSQGRLERSMENQEVGNFMCMPLTHTYEVTQQSDTSWIQNIDIPPFALDSDAFKCVIDREECFSYKTVLYKWNDDRKHPNEPGWQEVGEFPYIPVEDLETAKHRIRRLLLFI